MMKTVLFVCTGNYYRSRVAEILFNDLARRNDSQVMAISRGFRLNPEKNKGTLSPHAGPFLETLNIPVDPESKPTRLGLSDLENAHKIIVLDEKEHRHMMRSHFPDWENRVTYWSFEDDYIVSPGIVLPGIQSKVTAFFHELTQRSDDMDTRGGTNQNWRTAS
jgi:protein-tyrosine phosphatase